MPLEAEDIQALATALQGLRPESITIHATAVKLPPFGSGNPEVWFKQVESVFSTRKITVQQTKYDYVIQALDNSTADHVQVIILSPPEEPYDTLKAGLIEGIGKTSTEGSRGIKHQQVGRQEAVRATSTHSQSQCRFARCLKEVPPSLV